MNLRSNIKAVLAAEARAISEIEVTGAYEVAATLMAQCVGKVITTGMGKAGLVAQGLAATLCSTGTPAVFMHPGEAAHGDLGVLEPDDVVIAFSTSGKTAEVLEALDAGRTLCGDRLAHPLVIGVTSHADGAIRQRCDLILDMGVISEPCPLGLTPTASRAVMSAIGDALAIAVMQLKEFRREDFGKRHRGGYLGQVAAQQTEG